MLQKKISLKGLLGNIKNVLEKIDGKPTKIARIIGTANGVQTGESAHGTWVALKGDFRMFNLVDTKAEPHESHKAFLPDIVTDIVASKMEAGEKTVEFAYDIILKPDSESVTGYVYGAESLIEASVDNPLDRLQKTVEGTK